MPQSRSLGLVFGPVAVAFLLAVAQAQQARQAETSGRPAAAFIELTPEADTWYEVSVGTGAPVNPTPQGASERLKAGWSDVGIDEYALLRFALPTDLPAEQVARADLVLHIKAASIFSFDFPLPVSGTLSLSLSHVLTAWDETTLSSLTPPRVARLGGVLAEKEWWPCHGDDCGDALADVTPLVREWLDGNADNNGLALRASGHLGERPVMGTVFDVGSRESDHPPLLRIQLGSAQPTNAGEESPTPSPTLATPEAPSSPGLCLPLLLRGAWPDQTNATVAPTATATAPPTTATPLPPHTSTTTPAESPTAAITETAGTATAPPVDPYLFVERWQHEVWGPGCGMMLIDFPTYRFFPDKGVLRLYPFFGWNLPLEATDLGYYGSGRSLQGENVGGEDCGLERIVTLPFEADDVQIRSVDGDGAVVVARDGADVVLAPGGEKRWRWVGPGVAPGCVVTTTLRVTNCGYQDRQKIEISRLQ